MKKKIILGALCAVAVFSLSGCSKDYKSVKGYENCMSKNSKGDACFAFSNKECTSDIIDKISEANIAILPWYTYSKVNKTVEINPPNMKSKQTAQE